MSELESNLVHYFDTILLSIGGGVSDEVSLHGNYFLSHSTRKHPTVVNMRIEQHMLSQRRRSFSSKVFVNSGRLKKKSDGAGVE